MTTSHHKQYLAGTCDAERREESIRPIAAVRCQDALDQRQYFCAVE